MSKYRITIDGKTYEMEIELVPEEAASQAMVKKEYREFRGVDRDTTVRVIDPSAQRQIVKNTGIVTAPMPGTIIKIEKTKGNAVKTGDVVLILEAMKMENEILASSDGIITKINCEVGSTVAGGDVLFEIQ